MPTAVALSPLPATGQVGVARQRQQAGACPVRRDVEARQLSIRSLLAKAGDVCVDEARVPPNHVVIFELQSLACGMRRIDDEYVGPFDELFENLLSAWRLQIERYAAFIAVGQVPRIGILRLRLWRDLMPNSPEIAGRRLHFDDIGAEIRQDHGSAWTRDEARKVHHLQ